MDHVAGSVSSPIEARSHVARWSRKVVVDIIGVLDMGMILLASLITLYIHTSVGIDIAGGDYFAIQSALIAAGITRFMLVKGRMYNRNSLGNFPVKAISLCAAFGAGLFVVTSIFFAFGIVQKFHASWFPLWFVTGISLLILERAAAHYFLKKG